MHVNLLNPIKIYARKPAIFHNECYLLFFLIGRQCQSGEKLGKCVRERLVFLGVLVLFRGFYEFNEFLLFLRPIPPLDHN